MAFFSNQGTPFAQAVGGLFGPGKTPQGLPTSFHEGALGFTNPLGPLRSCRNGSLGDDQTACPECPPCPTSDEYAGAGASSEAGGDSFLATNTPHAYHDGIFQAPETTDETLQAEHDGSLSGAGLGLPLYVNGRLVEDPITIHHGYLSGLPRYWPIGVDPVPAAPAADNTNTYLMYGGIAAVAVLGIYLATRK